MQLSFSQKPTAVGPLGRWAVGPLGRWAVVTGVAAMCALSGARPVQAHWEVTNELQGTMHDDGVAPKERPWINNTSGNDDSPIRQGGLWGGTVWHFGAGGTMGANNTFDVAPTKSWIKGKVKVTWRWTPDDEDDTQAPPDKIVFAFNQYGWVDAESSAPVVATITGVTESKNSNGVSLDYHQQQGYDAATGRMYNSDIWGRNGTRLVTLSTNGQSEVSWTSPQLEVQGSTTGGVVAMDQTWCIGTGYFQLTGSSVEDDRSVTVSSSMIEASYYNSAALPPSDTPEGPETAGGPVPGVKTLHVPNADGSKDTDSVVRWRTGAWQVLGVGFIANTPGSWNNPTFAWSVTGDGTPGFGYAIPEQQPYSSLVLGLNMGNAPQGFPKSSNVQVTVRDSGNDSATGTNTFNVKWHLPYEKTFDLPKGASYRDVYWVSDSYITQGAIVAEVPAQNFDYGAAIDNVLVLAGVVGVPGVAETTEAVEVFKALSTLSQLGETQATYEVQATDVHDSHEEFGNTVRQHPDNIEGMTVAKRDQLQPLSSDDLRYEHDNYNTYVGRVRNHHKESFLADKYDEHGYVDSNHVFSHDVTEGQPEFENLYRLKNSTSPRPPIGDRIIPPSYNLS